MPRCRQMFVRDRRSTAHSCANLLFFSYSRFAVARRDKVNRVSGVETALTRSLLSPIQDMRSHGVAKLICSTSCHRLVDAGDRTAPQLDFRDDSSKSKIRMLEAVGSRHRQSHLVAAPTPLNPPDEDPCNPDSLLGPYSELPSLNSRSG